MRDLRASSTLSSAGGEPSAEDRGVLVGAGVILQTNGSVREASGRALWRDSPSCHAARDS